MKKPEAEIHRVQFHHPIHQIVISGSQDTLLYNFLLASARSDAKSLPKKKHDVA
jgi:hypothetical protein